jgi:hypothetical protein
MMIELNTMQVGILRQAIEHEITRVRGLSDVKMAERAAWLVELDQLLEVIK